MSSYNSFDGAHKHSTPISITSDKRKHKDAPPHLYSNPVFSAPLITAFGLPTLIECEQPLTSTVEEATKPPSSPQSQFTSVRARNRSLSLPPGSPSLEEKKPQRSLSEYFFGVISDQSGSTQSSSINAYTYRVRTLDTINNSDEHRLRLCQNPDGTYSHETTTTSNTMQSNTNNGEFAKDDVAESDTGLLMSQDPNRASVSLDTVTNLEETLTDMDSGKLPPHVHPSIPQEMLHPNFTRTTPPLKLWPLAVLVFYSEFYYLLFCMTCYFCSFLQHS